MKILMVCLGNICRSPLAEGILRDKIQKGNLDIEVDSAGTSGLHAGEAPDSRMIQTALNKGVDITKLRSRKFTSDDFNAFDLIYVMDKSNLKNVLDLAKNPAQANKVKLILEEITPNSKAEVPDPYFGGQAGFEHVFDLLDEACEVILQKINI